MSNYSMTYSQFGCSENLQISAKYVMDNLVMCENRVNTHSLRAYFTENILDVKELANLFSTILLHFSSDIYLRNGTLPLRVTVPKHCVIITITALSVGTHCALSGTPLFIAN